MSEINLLYRLPKVLEITGLSRSTIYAHIKIGDFPPPIKLFAGGRAVAWRSEQLTAWTGSLTRRTGV